MTNVIFHKKPNPLIIAKIDFVIHKLLIADYSYRNGRTADHFIKLRTRLKDGRKLTKKMKENLAWIEESVQEIENGN